MQYTGKDSTIVWEGKMMEHNGFPLLEVDGEAETPSVALAVGALVPDNWCKSGTRIRVTVTREPVS